MNLHNQTKNKLISSDVFKADTFFLRSKGLLGEATWPNNKAMWILKCGSIHTFFMNFAIDVVFVDKNLVVKKVCRQVKPWRLIFTHWTTDSVFEFAAGTIDDSKVTVGDQLHVGH